MWLNSAFSDVFNDKIANLMGETSYKTNANFINKIFANKSLYYNNGRLDMAKIIYALRSNGLLSSKFGQPSEVKLSFASRTSPMLLAKMSDDVLRSMGYSYFIISKAELVQGISSIEYAFNTEHSPDIGIILDELNKRGFICLDIVRKSAREWAYSLELGEPRLPNASFVGKNQVKLRETSGEYWIALSGAGELYIEPSMDVKRWNPRIVIFDKQFSILDVISNSESRGSFKVRVPVGAKFAMITDYDSSENLKSGIAVSIK